MRNLKYIVLTPTSREPKYVEIRLPKPDGTKLVRRYSISAYPSKEIAIDTAIGTRNILGRMAWGSDWDARLVSDSRRNLVRLVRQKKINITPRIVEIIGVGLDHGKEVPVCFFRVEFNDRSGGRLLACDFHFSDLVSRTDALREAVDFKLKTDVNL